MAEDSAGDKQSSLEDVIGQLKEQGHDVELVKHPNEYIVRVGKRERHFSKYFIRESDVISRVLSEIKNETEMQRKNSELAGG